MKSLQQISDSFSDQFDGLDEWIDKTYDDNFAKYFIDQREMIDKLNHSSEPVSDDYLEKILIEIPLQLFDVSEVVNKVRLKIEAIKLGIKEKESNKLSTLEDRLLVSAYESIVSRVEREMSYSRELIMSAKKIWDSREHGKNSMPVSEIDPECRTELPDYSGPSTHKSYIR